MANAQVKPAKENISFDDFAKLDIRAGKIIAAEKVAKTEEINEADDRYRYRYPHGRIRNR